jgi:hypothetical protein
MVRVPWGGIVRHLVLAIFAVVTLFSDCLGGVAVAEVAAGRESE